MADLDEGVRLYVEVLNANGVSTLESCQGGDGHAYPECTVRLIGSQADGYRALAVALDHALPVASLRRIWRIAHGELEGPYWDLVFSEQATAWRSPAYRSELRSRLA